MDSPLNQAHQQSRKADMMLKSKKFEEAMICHRRAADYLLEALQTTNSELAKESIYHQHQYHLRQQDNLQHKIDREERIQYNKTITPLVRHNQSTQTDQEVNDEAVLHAMSDTDSVLGFLVNRNKTFNDPRNKDITVHFRSEKQNVAHSITKIPRDDKDILEEMYVKNQELEKQVIQLSREVMDLRGEKKLLHDNLKLIESGGKDMFDIEEGSCIPDLMLPPLEMPQFDLDSLQSQTETDTETLTLFAND
ncbi:nuclear receptor-binding factor 2-like isoform X1 [Mytilus trossulus]|uniref:nuclear receptor-binding factor 2-like isoform X1 n=2 Tax=Mytilus trossulus TaxID=6551 RepID=UPI003003C490